MDKVLLSTGKDDWGTPQKLYDALNKEFGFTMDACADNTNYKHENYYTVETDGLKADWGGKPCFVTRLIASAKRTSPGRRIRSRKHTRKAAKMAQPSLC